MMHFETQFELEVKRVMRNKELVDEKENMLKEQLATILREEGYTRVASVEFSEKGVKVSGGSFSYKILTALANLIGEDFEIKIVDNPRFGGHIELIWNFEEVKE